MAAISHEAAFLQEVSASIASFDARQRKIVQEMTTALVALRDKGGRLFIIGLGGGAANAAHAVNDFRKLCHIEAYAPTDGISEFTAEVNDNGIDTVFENWLRRSKFCHEDALFVFSVGGGAGLVSKCITRAVSFVKHTGGTVMGVVGNPSGMTAVMGNHVVVIPVSDHARHKAWLTPLTEAFQMVVLHMLVSNPLLQLSETKW